MSDEDYLKQVYKAPKADPPKSDQPVNHTPTPGPLFTNPQADPTP